MTWPLMFVAALAVGGLAACGSDDAPTTPSPESTEGGVDVTAPESDQTDAGNSTQDEDGSGNQSDAGDPGAGTSPPSD